MTIKNIKTEINAVISDDDVLALDEYFKKTEKCVSKKLKKELSNFIWTIDYLNKHINKDERVGDN